MKKKKIHMKTMPPNLPSFTACGLWIYEVGKKHPAKQVVSREEFQNLIKGACGRCKNTVAYRGIDE